MNCGGRGLQNDWRNIPVQLTRRRGEVAPGDMQRGQSETSRCSYCASRVSVAHRRARGCRRDADGAAAVSAVWEKV